MRAFEAVLKLAYPDTAKARAIYDAVRPDNERLPRGLSIRTVLSGSTIKFEVRCEKGLGSLWATLDDLLECVQAAERALGQLSQRDKAR